MNKRGKRKAGESLLRCAPVRLMSAKVGESSISERGLRERVGYLVEMVAAMAESFLATHWNQADMDRYLKPSQPVFAYKAAGETFGWPKLKSPGFYAPSRVGYMALETAGRTMRGADFRRQIVGALIADTPLPARADAVSIRNARRSVAKYEKRTGHPATGFFDLEPEPPRVARQALLAVCDEQFCELSQRELGVLLPLISQPQIKQDWGWHAIPYRRPTYLTGAARKPTLRISGRKLMADMPFERDGVNPISLTPTWALGLDWGVNTPLVGSVVWLGPEGGPITDGHPVRFRADGLLSKIYRLCRQTEQLSARIDLFSHFIGVPLETEPDQVRSTNPLALKRATLWQERERVSKRYGKLLDELTHLCSRWAVEQALAHHCDTIVLEDLKSLEPQLNRRENLRVNLGLRGQIATYIRQKAVAEGLRVLIVDARGTSSHCSRCGSLTRHYASPDSRIAAYRWMRCPNPDCRVSLDRDHAGSERIGGRGLAPSAKSVTRVITPKPAPLALQALPARGPRAKFRRTLYETPGAGSPATPAPVDTFQGLPGHRPLEAEPQDPQSGLQASGTFDPGRPLFRPPRSLDGLRSAYLSAVVCSPVRGYEPAAAGYPS